MDTYISYLHGFFLVYGVKGVGVKNISKNYSMVMEKNFQFKFNPLSFYQFVDENSINGLGKSVSNRFFIHLSIIKTGFK